jgi:hypothetical protein
MLTALQSSSLESNYEQHKTLWTEWDSLAHKTAIEFILKVQRLLVHIRHLLHREWTAPACVMWWTGISGNAYLLCDVSTILTPWHEFASKLYWPSDSRLSWKLVPTFADRGYHVVSVTEPYGRILGFLDRSLYFFFQVAFQLYSRGWVDPVPDPLHLEKSGSVENRTRTSWICSQELWLLDHRGCRDTHTHTHIYIYIYYKYVCHILYVSCLVRLKILHI